MVCYKGNVSGPFTTRNSQGIRRCSVGSNVLLFSMTMRIFCHFLQVTFSCQVKAFPSLFVLPMRSRFRGVAFLRTFCIPIARPKSTILKKITVRSARLRAFLMIGSANRRGYRNELSSSSFLTNGNGWWQFFFRALSLCGRVGVWYYGAMVLVVMCHSALRGGKVPKGSRVPYRK